MQRSALVLMLAIAALFVLRPALSGQETLRYATLEERTVASLLARPPSGYISAVIEVTASCSMRCDGQCFDRVRIVDLLAQAPPPAEQFTVGSEFHLLSGSKAPADLPSPLPRYLVIVTPWSFPSCPYEGYGASRMGPPDPASIKSLRLAFEAAREK